MINCIKEVKKADVLKLLGELGVKQQQSASFMRMHWLMCDVTMLADRIWKKAVMRSNRLTACL